MKPTSSPHVWYVKWLATILIIIAVVCRSVDEVPKIIDVAFSLIGTLAWLYVSICWKDRALIILNAIMSFILATAAVRFVMENLDGIIQFIQRIG